MNVEDLKAVGTAVVISGLKSVALASGLVTIQTVLTKGTSGLADLNVMDLLGKK